MRTVVAVTAPVLAAGPKALTQSPTARSLEAADWVALTVVDFDEVIVSLTFLGAAGFLVLLLFELVERRSERLPNENLVPEMVIVELCTAVTLPDATESEASCLRKLLEPEPPRGKLGRLPLVPPSKPPPGNPRPPPGNPPALAGPDAPLAPDAVPERVHEPLDVGEETVMDRAAMVVFDFFEAEPFAKTQSPTANELTVSDTVLENEVVDVQLTVVWPVFAFCTSILVALRAATLPDTPLGRFEVVALSAGVATTASVTSTVAPPPRHRAQRRRFERGLVGVCISKVPLALSWSRFREFTVWVLLVA
jgi:hypothetical protein